MFDAKTYNDVRKTIGAANCLFAAVLIICVYGTVLTSEHKSLVTDLLNKLKVNPLISGLISVALLSAFWAYVSTVLLKLHDAVYEPMLVKWRASYDSDFILRALCFRYSYLVSPRLFEEAYDDSNKRNSFMTRLFYKFMGDETKNHLALLTFFYTDIRNYWVIVLAELYCLAFLCLSAGYASLFHPCRNTYPFILISILVAIGLRVWANFYLDKPRRLTREQIRTVLREHTKDFETELTNVVEEYNLKVGR